jgi:putative hydrolase of HD superfamily
MVTKSCGPDELFDFDPSGDPVLSSYYRVMRLKRLFRQGWLKRGIPQHLCETVAEHSFGVALLCILAPAPEDVDRSKALLMAVVHELGETYAGDITPVDGVSPEEKSALEREALLRALEGHPECASLLSVWEEFEDGSSPEARFVRQLDRLEMGFQAALYQAEGSTRMEEFFASAHRSVVDPTLVRLLDRAIERSVETDLQLTRSSQNDIIQDDHTITPPSD